MKIKSIKVDSFGKFKLKKPIRFNEGLNIIYGPNEAGKSTLLNFIKTMFFGMEAKRGRTREPSERELFIPWDSDYSSGCMIIETDDGKQYRIQRRFNRNNQKLDVVEVIDEVTGEAKKIFGEPGIEFMGISRETFENTLFVRQLSCSDVQDDNRQIYSRIVSLRETGNENIQAGKAKNILKQKIDDLESRKKDVSIDWIDKQIDEKKSELDLLYGLHKKMLDYETELNKCRLHYNIAENNFRILEKKRRNADLWKKKKIYESALGYIIEKKELDEKLDKLEEYVLFSEADQEGYISLRNKRESILGLLDEKNKVKAAVEEAVAELTARRKNWELTAENIEELREKKQEYKALLENFNNHNKKATELKVRISQLNKELEKFKGFENYDSDIDIILKEKLDELSDIDRRIVEYEENIRKYGKFTEELEAYEASLREAAGKLGYEELPDVSESDFGKEEYINREMAEINSNNWLIRKTLEKERLEGEKANLEKSLKGPTYNLVPSICLFAAGIAASFIFWSPLTFWPLLVLCAAGVLLYTTGQSKERKKLEILTAVSENIERVKEELKDSEGRKKENTEWLDAFYKKLKLEGRDQFLKVKKDFETFFAERNRLTAAMDELKKNISSININEQTYMLEGMKARKVQLNEFIENAYNTCECDGYNSFCRKFKQYTELKTSLSGIEEMYKGVTEDMDVCNAGIEAIRERVREIFKLASMKPEENIVLSIERLIKDYEENLKVMDLLGASEKRLEEQMNEVEKNNKDLEQIKSEIDKILSHVDVKTENEFVEGVEKYGEYVLASQRSKQLDELIASTLGEYDIGELEKECAGVECECCEEPVAELDAQIKEESRRIHEIKESIVKIETTIDNISGLEKIPALENEINELESTKKKMQEKLETLRIALYVLEGCLDEMTRQFGTTLNEKAEEIVARLTGGRYSEVKINESDLAIKAYEPDAGKFVNVGLLSNGTIDQMYFAMRLAIADMVEGNTRLPVILDDAFTQYDDVRLNNTMEFLLEHSKSRQIILFTCREREMELLKNFGAAKKISYYDLSTAE